MTNVTLAFRREAQLGSVLQVYNLPGNWTTRMLAPPFMLGENFMNEPRLYHPQRGRGVRLTATQACILV